MLRKIFRFQLIALSALLIVSFHSAEEKSKSLNQHPQAPPETSQFAFMIGEFVVTSKSPEPFGDGKEYKGKWDAHWILNGWAIQDEWYSTDKDGNLYISGINIRSFNRELGKWECRWLPTPTLKWKHFTAEKVNETMVMLGKGQDKRGEFLDRNIFYNIRDDGYSWKKDRSYDNGLTWNEGVFLIEATRLR